MITDNLTAFLTVWSVATIIAVIAITVCNGCCIKKIMGKPCP